jgi:hypothetical protein
MAGEFETVFQIGRIDVSSSDLKTVSLDRTIESYAVGKPISPGEWPAVQPGAHDAWAGSRPYSFSFEFEPRQKSGTYRLRIGILGGHPWTPPKLRVRLGKDIIGEFRVAPGRQLHPKDGTLQETSPALFEIDVPGALLPAGKTLVTIEQAGPCSWVFYDGIEVLHTTEELPGQISDLSVTMLPMIRRESDSGRGEQAGRIRTNVRGLRPPVTMRCELPSGALTRTIGTGDAVVLNGALEADFTLPTASETRTFEVSISAGTSRALARVTQRALRPFEIYVVPQAHFDNGYTDPQEECVKRHMVNIDRALELAEKHENFSWTSESAYIVDRWWRQANDETRARYDKLLTSGRFGFDAAYVNILSGLCTGEELYRLFSFAGGFARMHRVDLKTATITDAPSHTWSLPQVLASCGIEFLSIGSNTDRAGLAQLEKDLFYNPFEWEAPNGARVLTFVHKHYAHATQVGLTDSLEAAEAGMPKWLEPYDTPDYKLNVIHLHGAYWDNALLDERLPKVVQQWNDKYEWPKVRLTTNADFFKRVRQEGRREFQVLRGDGGAYWEDGAASSAQQTAINRRNQRRLELIETVLAGLHAQGKLKEYPAEALRAAWENVLLYDEHTWGAAWSISNPQDPAALEQFAVKARYATDAQRGIDGLFELAATHLPGLKSPEHVPSAAGVRVQERTISSPYYRVTLNAEKGLITSITDLNSQRELVERPTEEGEPRPYGFAQLIYAHKPRPAQPSGNDLAIDSAVTVPRFISTEPIPGGVRVRFEHEVFPRIEMTITLDSAAKRVDIEYELEKKASRDLEGVYIAFPFAFESPEIDYEAAGAVVRAGRDWLPRACLDWFAVQEFVRLRDTHDGFCAVWTTPDAPLIELQGINTHQHLSTLPIQNGRVFSYVMNNYWHTNYKAAQEGRFVFRYSITSGKDISNAAASRFGRLWSPPVEAAVAQLVSVDNSHICVMSFKRADDGHGYVLRLREMDGTHGYATVTIGALGIKPVSALPVNGIEWSHAEQSSLSKLEDGKLRIHLHPYEIATWRLLPED